MISKSIYFVAGTKGGVGKSTFAIFLANAAEDLQKKFIVYDSDSENKTLCTFLPDSAVFLDDSNNDYPLDAVINTVLDEADETEISIVDMKAGTSRSVQQWFSEVPWKLIEENKVSIYIVCCLTSDPDSVRSVLPWITYMGDKPVTPVIAMNEKDGIDFSFFRASELEQVFKYNKWPIFSVLEINKQYQTELNNHSLTLRDAAAGRKRLPGRSGVMEISRMKKYYDTIIEPIKKHLQEGKE